MKIIKYNIDDFKDITSMQDFYERIGVFNKSKGECLIKSVSQIKMERKNCEKLRDFMLANQKLQKESRVRRWSKKIYENAVSLEWANFSPVCSVDMPNDEIHIIESEANNEVKS